MKTTRALLLLLISLSSYSQNLNITNQNTFGGAGDDDLQMIPSPLNDGYYFIGSSASFITGIKTEGSRGGLDIWVVKTDLNFTPVWDKTIGANSSDQVSSFLISDNKIYVLTESASDDNGEKTMPSFGGFDMWLVCLDLNGGILWQKQYGGTNEERFPRIIEFSPNSLLIACTSDSPVSGNKTIPGYNALRDIWVLEIAKSDGTVIQEKVIGSNEEETSIRMIKTGGFTYISAVVSSSNSGAAPSGDRTQSTYGNLDGWIAKLDDNFNVIQDKCFGGTENDGTAELTALNGALFVSGFSSSGISGNKTVAAINPSDNTKSDAWLLKLDDNLNIEWQKVYGGTNQEGIGPIFQNSNGNLVLSMVSNSLPSGNKTAPRFGTDYDLWLVITDYEGEIIAQQTYGGLDTDLGSFQPYPNSDQDLFMTSFSRSLASGNKTISPFGDWDCWIAKINAANFLSTEKLSGSAGTISVYPNPFENHVNFDFSDLTEDVLLQIYSVDGKLVSSQTIPSGTKAFEWNSATNDQLFIYKVSGDSVNHTGKILKK